MLSQCFLCWPAIAFTHWYKIGIHWNSSETREFDSKPVGHCLRRHARMHARTERRTGRKHNAAAAHIGRCRHKNFTVPPRVWSMVTCAWKLVFRHGVSLRWTLASKQASVDYSAVPVWGRSIAMSICMPACVCRLSGTTRPMFTQFCACYLMPWLVFLWRCDTLCTSGFMNDVIFAHNDVRNICDTKRHILSDSTGAARFRHRGEYSD